MIQNSWARRVGGAVMLGAAIVAAAVPAAQPPELTPYVVVLDEFPSADQPTAVSHGTLVESVLVQRAPVPVRREQVSLGASMEKIQQQEPGALDQYVVQRFETPTRETAEVLSRLRGPAVASQSQGASESRVVDALWGAAQGNAATRAFLARELGVAGDASDAEFLQALVDRVDNVHSHSSEIHQARQQLLQAARKARENGVIRVLSAGNQGQLDRQLEQLNVSISRDFYFSDLVDGAAIVVGAADDRGTPDRADDGAAPIASPGAGAIVAAYGINVPVVVNGEIQYHTGSSYAQPQVAALVARWQAQDPTLTPEAAQQKLLEQARPVAGQEAELGYGIIEDGWQFASRPS